MDAYRGSQLRLLRSCAFAYEREYVDRTAGSPSPALQSGRNVHAAIPEALRAILADGLVNVHEIAYRCTQGGDVEYADAIRVLTTFQEALGVDFDIDPKGVILVEQKLTMPLTLTDGTQVQFYGTPDLVERVGRKTLRITDWKTHWKPMSDEECEADPQLRRYALLVDREFPGYERFVLIRRFIRYRNNFHEQVVTAADLPAIEAELVAEIEEERRRRAAGDFPATGGDWCALCSHHAACPLINDLRAIEADELSIPDDDRARELAGRAIALDAAADRLKAQLKAYLGGEHGTGYVDVAGGTYGYVPVAQRYVPPAELQRVCEQHGVELPPELFRDDLKVLDRLAKRLPDAIVREIEGITVHSQTSRCQFRRGKAPKKAAPAPAVAAVTEEIP